MHYSIGKYFLFAILFILLIGPAVLWAQREPVPSDPTVTEKPVVEPIATKKVQRMRIREGSTFRGKTVFFRRAGTRTALYSLDGNEHYICLENLNLQRILEAIEKKPTRSTWRIDGMFTEFQGENYVLIQRAVVAPADFSSEQESDFTAPVDATKKE